MGDGQWAERERRREMGMLLSRGGWAVVREEWRGRESERECMIKTRRVCDCPFEAIC